MFWFKRDKNLLMEISQLAEYMLVKPTFICKNGMLLLSLPLTVSHL